MNPSNLHVSRDGGNVRVAGNLVVDSVGRVLATMHQARKRGFASITLDFSATTLAFPGPVLAVLAACIRLRDEYDVDVSLVRPADGSLRRLFANANWAHLAAPQQFAQSAWHPASVLPASRFRAGWSSSATTPHESAWNSPSPMPAKAFPPA